MRTYENNKIKAYALLWEGCAKGMQQKILARTNYTSEIKNNPIKLKQAIRNHALNYHENRYKMSIILDSMRALLGTRQKENKLLVDYTRRFKTARDVFESHLDGPIILKKYVESMQGFDPTNTTKNSKMITQAA